MKKFLLLFSILVFCPVLSSAMDKIKINTASLEQLDGLTGVGPVIAQRIIDARPFSSVDDLLRVKGIGEKTLQKIKDQELAYVEGQTQQSAKEVSKAQSPTPAPSATLAPTPSTTPAPAMTGVVFNEIMPSPEGADEKEEWIEIFNQNDFEADLSGWKIKDGAGKITTFIIPEKTKIKPKGFLVLARPLTKIVLNNDQDSLEFIRPDGSPADKVSYQNAVRGQSFNRNANDWFWSASLTPGLENALPGDTLPENALSENALAERTEVNPESSFQPAEDESPRAEFRDEGTAAIGQKAEKSFSFLIIITIAAGLAIFSATAILFLKKRIKSNGL